MAIVLKKFDPNILEYKRNTGHAPVIVIIGKRGSGKSMIIEDIVSYLKVPIAISMSGSEDGNGFYSKHLHKLFTYSSFKSEVIEDIIIKQKAKAKDIAKKTNNIKKLSDFPQHGVLIIMDDLAYDASMMKDPVIREIFFNGRHYNITLIMAFQYLMNIPPAFRTNIDYVFIGREVTKDFVDKLYKYFFGIFRTSKEFSVAYRKYTENYGYLVLDKTTRSDDILDNVFQFRAELGKKYRIAGHMWSMFDKKLLSDQE